VFDDEYVVGEGGGGRLGMGSLRKRGGTTLSSLAAKKDEARREAARAAIARAVSVPFVAPTLGVARHGRDKSPLPLLRSRPPTRGAPCRPLSVTSSLIEDSAFFTVSVANQTERPSTSMGTSAEKRRPASKCEGFQMERPSTSAF
jgi:hypothetical protein